VLPGHPANLAVYQRGRGYQGGTGYPMVRLQALLACGTRTVVDAVFGTDRIGETSGWPTATSPPRPGSLRSPAPARTCWCG
jgi:hypothetical protein